jgi:hypothetical protein
VSRLLYLYGIVGADAPEPPEEFSGLEGLPVRLVRAGSVAGIVGEVPAGEYAGEALDRRLSQLDWVGERGIAHERVLTWFADRGAVIPLKPFSLHQSAEAVVERLAVGEESFRQTLDRLAGRQEWGIRLWADEERVLAHLHEISPPIRELSEEIHAAAPGRRFLLTRKKEAIEADELRSSSLAVARHVYEALSDVADSAVRLPIPPPQGERLLVLHAAYLVAEPEFERFGTLGFACDFTGPWPPYHFAES